VVVLDPRFGAVLAMVHKALMATVSKEAKAPVESQDEDNHTVLPKAH
jgi:hypothetical protein